MSAFGGKADRMPLAARWGTDAGDWY